MMTPLLLIKERRVWLACKMSNVLVAFGVEHGRFMPGYEIINNVFNMASAKRLFHYP